jgi:hypothetical protein
MNVSSYSAAPEIHQYLKDVASRFKLLKYIKLKHTVVGATWSEEESRWHLRVHDQENDAIFDDWCDFLINASGILKSVLLFRRSFRSLTLPAVAIGSGLLLQVYILSKGNSSIVLHGLKMSS